MDNCLEESVLKAFANGRVSDATAAKIERHLEQCGHCLEQADRLRSQSDSLVLALQNLWEGDSHDADPELAPVLASISDLRELSRIGEFHLPSNSLGTVPSVRDYLLLRKLGEGGMGTVFLALHTRLDKHVALKILRCDSKNRLEAVSRFEREMRLVGKLEHPNIVRALDAGEEEGTHFLVMEYIDGVDLRNLVRTLGCLKIADACELIRQAALGLQHAHENGMIHRDVKPSNLMLSPDGQVKVLDLGLAQFWRPFSNRNPLTGTKQVLGTFAYMSPEQCTGGGNVDIRTDVFSLGVSFYELLAGRLPLNPGELAVALPDIRRYRNDIPDELRHVLNAMLEHSVEDRLECMATVARGLEPWTHGANLELLLEKYQDPDSALSMQESPQISGGSMSGQVSQVNTQSWGTTARELPPPVPPPRQDQDTAKQTPLVPREAPAATVPFWKRPLVAALTGSTLALCVVLVIVLGPSPKKKENEKTDLVLPTQGTGTVVVWSKFDFVQETLQDKYPYLKARAVETDADPITLHLEENELPVGEYRLWLLKDAWYFEVDHLGKKFEVGEMGTKFTVEEDRTLHFRVSVDIDYPFQYPVIPKEYGASVTYSGTFSEMTYTLKLLVMGEDPFTECRWLKVEVTNRREDYNYTETGYLLVDTKTYEKNQDLDIVQGWLLADSPKISHSLRHRESAGLSEFVVPLPVKELDRDPIRETADRLGLPLPEARLSVYDALVVLFNAEISAASEWARQLRANLPKLDLEFDQQTCVSLRPPDDCFIVQSQNRITFPNGQQEPVYQLWLHPDVPFRFVQFQAGPQVPSLAYDTHCSRDDPEAQPAPPEGLAAQAELLKELPGDPPWDIAWLKRTKDGMWVKYDVVLSDPRQRVKADLKKPVEVTVHVGKGLDEIPGVRYRWIEIDVVNHPPNAAGNTVHQKAGLLIDEDAYPQEFKVIRGWIQREGRTFEFAPGGDDTAMVEGLHLLGTPPEPVELSVFDALELLFDARLKAAQEELRGLRGVLRVMLRTDKDRQDAGTMSYPYKKQEGLPKMLVDVWVSHEDESGRRATVERSREVPLGFYRVRVDLGNQPYLTAYVADYYPREDDEDSEFDSKSRAAFFDNEAKKTQDAIPRNLKNFRSWTSPDGEQFWAEYGGNIGSGPQEKAVFYDRQGGRLYEFFYNELAENEREHIRRGRKFQIASNQDSWFGAKIEGFTNFNPIAPNVIVTDAGTTEYQEGELVPSPMTVVSPADRIWIRKYAEKRYRWGL